MAERQPLSAVLEVLSTGVTNRADLARLTDLPVDVVEAALDHLMRTGAITTESLASACPTGGCSGCPSPTGSGCSTASERNPGPVLLTLTRRPSTA